VGVDRRARPGDAVPPARGRVPRSGRAGDVRIAGERMQHHDDVVASRGQLAPALDGDADVVEHHTAFQLECTDVDDRGLTLGGQDGVREYALFGDGHVRLTQNAATAWGSGCPTAPAAAKPR